MLRWLGDSSVNPRLPLTGLLQLWLFTAGRGMPSLLNELRAEMSSCDRLRGEGVARRAAYSLACQSLDLSSPRLNPDLCSVKMGYATDLRKVSVCKKEPAAVFFYLINTSRACKKPVFSVLTRLSRLKSSLFLSWQSVTEIGVHRHH